MNETYVMRDGLPWVEMAAGDTSPWSRDWTGELVDGDAIASSVWTVPVGLTAGAATQSGPYATQWVTALEPGTFALVNKMTSASGLVLNRTLMIEVVDAK